MGSTKDRAAQNKRPKPPKQRRDDSESFDRRSQYTPFFPQPQVPTWVPQPQYSTMSTQPFNATLQNNYQPAIPPQYVQPSQQYNQNMMSNGNMQQYNNMAQQYPQQPMYQNQTPYQPQTPGRGPPSSIPYAFGQLPSTVNPADPKRQHPIPGSFNRHAFNPKTQSFVPNNPGLPIPQPISHHGSPHQGSPHHGSPHLPYNGFAPSQPQYGNGMGYNMVRQGS